MDCKSPEKLFPHVFRPSRYLGREINAVFKDPARVGLHMALAFPDLYDIGTSHFGLQILYDALNRESAIYAERVFAPAEDMARALSGSAVSLFSLETRTPLSRFDIVGFSLLYELNYTNVLFMLDLAGIPFFAAGRDESHPVIIAGGPCTVNPEPVADFFDAIVIGDGEVVLPEMAKTAMALKCGGRFNRHRLLEAWSAFEGVYIPSFFKASTDSEGAQRLVRCNAGPDRITRAIVPDLDHAPFPDAPVVPFGRPVHDRLRIEIARGCSRGCRFCQAGMIYRPVRERSFPGTADLAHRSIAATGYGDLSLLSLSTGDYSCLSPLMTHLMDHFAGKQIGISIPSFRAGSLPADLMERIRTVRKTGFTIAPEAGSERLRSVINKNISEAEIVETITDACNLGWNLVKLYFMIGLPTETEDDLNAIVRLVKRLKKMKAPGKRHFNINASVSTFIPKSHTPFQWVKQESLDNASEKIEKIRQDLKMPGVQFKWQNPETSFLEGLLARGDRRLSRLLVAAYRNGCRFDGWTDAFRFTKWKNAFDQAGIDPATEALRPASFGAKLPWEHIDTRISPDFLKEEYTRAYKAIPTSDCRNGECHGCGACDFETIRPVTAAELSCETTELSSFFPGESEETACLSGKAAGSDTGKQDLCFTFTRKGPARFFAHLEQVNIFTRALPRAGLSVVFSSGYNPKPKIVFEDALPVGIESLEEKFYVSVYGPVCPGNVIEALNQQLPEGLEITDCLPGSRKNVANSEGVTVYSVEIPGKPFSAEAIKHFENARTFPCRQKSPKGKEKTLDLKQHVSDIEMPSPERIRLSLYSRPGSGIRPIPVLRCIFGLDDAAIASAVIVKEKMLIPAGKKGK